MKKLADAAEDALFDRNAVNGAAAYRIKNNY